MRLRHALASTAVALALSRVTAAAPARSPAPRFEVVRQTLCASQALPPPLCKESSFAAPHAIDVDEGRLPAWVYVLRRDPAHCFVRDPCFTLVRQTWSGWRAVLSTVGGTVAFLGDRARPGPRDLVVTRGNTACERQHLHFGWQRGSYRLRRSAPCALADCPSSSRRVRERSARDGLCTSLRGELVLN